jgi:uncharacterized protein YuzE
VEVRYYPSSDMLNLRLADQESVESEEAMDGFVFDFDADGKVVGIEVEDASSRVDLTFVKQMPSAVVQETTHEGEVYTAAEMAERLGIDKRTFNRVVRNMRGHGL